MTSPSTQQIDREMANATNLESDLSVSGDEGLSDNTGSTTTETNAYVEYPGTGVVFLPENSCRAIYKHRSHPKDKALHLHAQEFVPEARWRIPHQAKGKE